MHEFLILTTLFIVLVPAFIAGVVWGILVVFEIIKIFKD